MPASHATTTNGPWFGLPQYDDVAQTKTNKVWAALDGEPDGVELVTNGGFDSDLNRIALEYADRIIVPVSPSTTEVLGYMTFVAILRSIGVESCDILLNNIHHSTTDLSSISAPFTATGFGAMLPVAVKRRKIFEDTLSRGESIFDTSDTKAIDDIKGVVYAIKKQI
jgi:chromosome partitioning protein